MPDSHPENGALGLRPWYIGRCNITGICKCLPLSDSRSCASLVMAPSIPAKTSPRTVGLTRARVSQLLKEAETAGLALERIRGRGYRLLATPDFLAADQVRAALSENRPQESAIPLLAIEVVDEIASTSTELLRRAQRKDIHGTVLAAEWQTAGRGRRGRKWTAVAGGSLTFSLGWRFEQGAGYLAGLSLAVGVAVIRALEAEGLPGVELKWPNDLIYRHLKVGGILVELNGDALGPSTVVVGVGLNVRMPATAKRDIDQPVSDLTAVAGRGAAPIDRNRLLARARRRAGYWRFPPMRIRASRRLPRNGSAATPIRASRSGCCCPTARASRARSRASTARARWCWPTARAARVSCPAKSRCAAPDPAFTGVWPGRG